MAGHSLQVEIFTLCDIALVSKDNKLSIIGIFDQIIADKIPFNFPKMSLVAVVTGQPHSSHSLRLTITDPAGKNLIDLTLQVALGESKSSNLISEIANLPLSLPGDYQISLFEGKKELISRTLHIRRIKKASPLPS